MSIHEIIARALPFTVGNGEPDYRTDPATHQRYTPAQMSTFAVETGKIYNMPENVYIQEEQHLLNVSG